MSGKVAGKVHHQRECEWCHGGIAEQRPVFLVTSEEGSIIGLYHAGCAAKIVNATKGKRPLPEPRGGYFGRIVPKPREETLPW